MLRIGLVGCGFMGKMHASVYQLLDGAKLVAVADRKQERADKFARDFGGASYPSLSSLLESEEVDAVDICLPTFLHSEATIEAARAGKHIICEKPMALRLEEASRMEEACKTAGVRLMIAHCIRFWPEYALLKQIIEDRRFGSLLSLNLTRYGEFPTWSSDNWLADESLSGGGVLDMHIHDTDFALYALGEPKQMVSFGTVDERGPSHAFTTMLYPECIVHLEGGWNLAEKTPFKMSFRAVFERGSAIMDDGPMMLYADGKDPQKPDFPKMEASGGGNISDLGGYYHELKYFLDCVSGGQPLARATPESARLSVATVLEEIRQIKANQI